jgi:DNA-binding CsgD family transcriptional regulator
MLFWQKITHKLTRRTAGCALRLELEEPYDFLLQSLALIEQRPPETVAAGLLCSALNERRQADENLARWRALSPREQEVAALACLNLTNRQIAARLCISHETVKTHIHNLLLKFSLHTKTELRRMLFGWDFSAWQ